MEAPDQNRQQHVPTQRVEEAAFTSEVQIPKKRSEYKCLSKGGLCLHMTTMSAHQTELSLLSLASCQKACGSLTARSWQFAEVNVGRVAGGFGKLEDCCDC